MADIDDLTPGTETDDATVLEAGIKAPVTATGDIFGAQFMSAHLSAHGPHSVTSTVQSTNEHAV